MKKKSNKNGYAKVLKDKHWNVDSIKSQTIRRTFRQITVTLCSLF